SVKSGRTNTEGTNRIVWIIVRRVFGGLRVGKNLEETQEPARVYLTIKSRSILVNTFNSRGKINQVSAAPYNLQRRIGAGRTDGKHISTDSANAPRIRLSTLQQKRGRPRPDHPVQKVVR